MSELQLSLTDLLFWPIALPVRGFVFLLEEIREASDRELYDPGVVRQRLVDLQLRYEMGEVSEDEYALQWAALSQRLAALGSGHVLEE